MIYAISILTFLAFVLPMIFIVEYYSYPNKVERPSLVVQHGGSHYKDKPIQPVELWAQLDLDGFRASIVKYLTRYQDKNGVQDLDKAEHFFHIMVDLKKYKAPWWMTWKGNRLDKRTKKVLDKYCSDNNLHHDVRLCLIYALKRPWSSQDEYNNQEAFRTAIARLKEDLRYNLATG